MANLLDCPESECWRALLDVDLAPEQRECFERHLETCPACQARIDQTQECQDTLRRLGRQFGDPTLAPADPTLAQVRERLHEVKATAGATAADPADLSFLRPSDRPGVLGVLDGYEVVEVIGQGGMGVVLKAYEPALQRLVAIKVLASALAGSRTARLRFTREAQAAAVVCHDHVVPIHCVHEADGLPYLVMQYIAGESLQDRLDRIGPLELVEIVRIGHQTAAGLAVAHAQGLIHRDIKPANLLLETRDEPRLSGSADAVSLPDNSGSSLHVKITDFGLARMIDDVGLTQNGVVAGTPEYMAPEQARGEPVDHRADLFSLGSVLYALCTGAPPFRSSSAVAVLRRVSEEEPAPVRTLNPDVPAWLDAIVARLMAKDPANRFQSAAEVATLLEGYLAHLRQPATLFPTRFEAWRSRRPIRHSVLLALCLLLLLVLVVRGLKSPLAGMGGETPPRKEYLQEFFQSFKEGPDKWQRWDVFGPDANECVRFEPDGVRITLPRGFPESRPYTGLSTGIEVNGDFEVTVHFELLPHLAGEGAWNQHARFTLETIVEKPGMINLSRSFESDGKQFFGAWYSLRNEVTGKDKSQWKGAPTQAMSGRLRLVRIGAVVSYYVAEESESDFKLIQEYPWSSEPLKEILLIGWTGSPGGSLDVRVTDLRIRADSFPDLPETTVAAPEKSGGRGWLAAGGILALVLLLSAAIPLGAWLYGRQRRRARTMPPGPALSPGGIGQGEGKDKQAEPATGSPSLTVQCSGCGQKLRARPNPAGKKVKCPACGRAVLVPGIKTASSDSTLG